MLTKEEIVQYMEQQAVRPLSEEELAGDFSLDTEEGLVQLNG